MQPLKKFREFGLHYAIAVGGGEKGPKYARTLNHDEDLLAVFIAFFVLRVAKWLIV
jgi:hypothetical protein